MAYLKWWYDSGKSELWELFDDDQTYIERSYAGACFYKNFHMPRVVFDAVLQALHVKFADKTHGDGKPGSRSQPLVLKLGACILMLT